MLVDDFFESVILYIEVQNGHDEIDSIDDLLNAINSHRQIEVVYNVLVHNDNRIPFTFDYIQFENRSTKAFKLRLLSNHQYQVSTGLKRALIKLFELRNLKVSTLWDDTYRKYSYEAYIKIHNIENRLRAKLNEEMLNNYGEKWHKIYFPPKLKHNISQKIRKKKNVTSQDLFMSCDFIELNKFLFEEFRKENIDRIISNSERINFELLARLKESTLQNNWNRIFVHVFNSNRDEFETKWQSLYELRNLIAHNRPFSKSNLEASTKLIDFFNGLLLKSKKYFRPGVKVVSTTRSGSEYERCPECGGIHYFQTTISSNLYPQIQKALKDKGYDNPCDGLSSKDFTKALINFQKDNGLPVGGFNIETLKALKIN